MKFMRILFLSLLVLSQPFVHQAGAEQSAGGRMALPHICASLPLDILDVVVTPHQFSRELRYGKVADEELGTLVRLVVAHREAKGKDLTLELAFNGKKPSELLQSGDWCWYEMPENLGTGDKPYTLAPGAVEVFTFNAGKAAWGVGKVFELTLTNAQNKATETLNVPLIPSDIQITSVSCLSSVPGSIYPDSMVMHISNGSVSPTSVREVAVFPTALASSRLKAKLEFFGRKAGIVAGERSGVVAVTGKLPVRRGVVELLVDSGNGKTQSLYAPLMYKVDRFDIGSGWLDVPSKPGIVPLTRESYLKLLTRMHVNLIHNENVPGYTDSDLYKAYPMRLMSGFPDVEKYNTDEWVARIHGVDILGEPQMGVSPMKSCEKLHHYAAARYPTTVTLSDEKEWRYYAGLSDYPHFDAYRVSAPAMDAWHRYDRWDGKKIAWGAPLEGVGVLTRSLLAQSRPAPIAAWAQNVHEGWRDQFMRKRKSPTPDEILTQAYEALANGVKSLYWYSLQSWSLLKYRDCIDITTRIGREIRALDDLYTAGDATWHQRVDKDGKPNLDLNVVAAPKAALLFAMDLDYHPDLDARVFKFRGSREVDAEFPLPAWLREPVDLFRIDAHGTHDVRWTVTEAGVKISDQVDRVAVYVATPDGNARAERAKRIEELKAAEAALGFDPAANDADFMVLCRDLGFEDTRDLEKFK